MVWGCVSASSLYYVLRNHEMLLLHNKRCREGSIITTMYIFVFADLVTVNPAKLLQTLHSLPLSLNLNFNTFP